MHKLLRSLGSDRRREIHPRVVSLPNRIEVLMAAADRSGDGGDGGDRGDSGDGGNGGDGGDRGDGGGRGDRGDRCDVRGIRGDRGSSPSLPSDPFTAVDSRPHPTLRVLHVYTI